MHWILPCAKDAAVCWLHRQTTVNVTVGPPKDIRWKRILLPELANKRLRPYWAEVKMSQFWTNPAVLMPRSKPRPHLRSEVSTQHLSNKSDITTNRATYSSLLTSWALGGRVEQFIPSPTSPFRRKWTENSPVHFVLRGPVGEGGTLFATPAQPSRVIRRTFNVLSGPTDQFGPAATSSFLCLWI